MGGTGEERVGVEGRGVMLVALSPPQRLFQWGMEGKEKTPKMKNS